MIRRIRSFGIVGVWMVLTVVGLGGAVFIGQAAKEIERLRQAGALPQPAGWWENARSLWSAGMERLDGALSIPLLVVILMTIMAAVFVAGRRGLKVGHEKGNAFIALLVPLMAIVALVVFGGVFLAGQKPTAAAIPDEVMINKCLRNVRALMGPGCEMASHDLQDLIEGERSTWRRLCSQRGGRAEVCRWVK